MIDWQQLRLNLRERRVLRAIDWHFAQLMGQLGADEAVMTAAALTSRALSLGDSCLPVTQLREQLKEIEPACVGLEWSELLKDSPVVGPEQPLVFDGARIYLQRYWQFEGQLAQRLSVGARRHRPAPSKVKPILNKLFGPQGESIDWQRVAAAQACMRQLLVISGGPGTGKTTTVARLLALLQELAIKDRGLPLEVALIAPTGKAAARLSDSIAQARLSLTNSSDIVVASIPTQASTIHRFLGVIPGRHQFIHHAENPVMAELVVIDEASMIDLSLMTRLFAAIAPSTQVIILGDRDQLASVEAGSVLADICEFIDQPHSHAFADYLRRCDAADLKTQESEQVAATIVDNLVMLKHSYRFNERSGIGQLARAVNRGDSTRALRHFENDQFTDITWRDLTADSYAFTIESTVIACQRYLSALKQGRPLRDVFRIFGEFQLLVALRQGDFGVEGLNTRLQFELFKRGTLSEPQGWCEGLPIMIQSNDHVQQLYNGDIGIFTHDANGTLMVAFENANAADGIRWILPSRLPEHECVFAMTVHKSQGSEFAQVMLLLPRQGSGNPTRELLYTGITRSRNAFTLIADAMSFKRACASRTRRSTGLAHRLANLSNSLINIAD